MSRTFAMRGFAATYWVIAVDFVYIFIVLVLPQLATQPGAADFAPLLLVFLALFVVAAAAATFWPGAPRRPWFWLVAALPSVLFLLLNAPFLPFTLTHPIDPTFAALLPFIVGTVVIVVTGIRAYGEARSGAPAGAPSTRALIVLSAVVAATAGAMVTSVLAATGGGGSVGQVDATVVLEAKNTAFVPTSLTAATGQSLGVVVVNRDAFAHAFDIDALNIHIALPGNSSTLVVLKPTAAGDLEYYCSLPGHKEAGMDGAITVQ